jgi:hypothetical protein
VEEEAGGGGEGEEEEMINLSQRGAWYGMALGVFGRGGRDLRSMQLLGTQIHRYTLRDRSYDKRGVRGNEQKTAAVFFWHFIPSP